MGTFKVNGDISSEKLLVTKHIKVGSDLDMYNTVRAEVSVVTSTDNPGELWLGANSARIWSISARGSSENNVLQVYNLLAKANAMIIGNDNKVNFYQNVTAPSFTGSLSGNADTATKLATARTISLTGSVTGSGSFDGSGNLSIATTTNHTHSYLPLSGGTVTGTLVLSRTTDAAGTSETKPALIIGGTSSTAHIQIDNNEILAKSNGTTPTTLNLNTNGGLVSIGTGGLKVNGDVTVTTNIAAASIGLTGTAPITFYGNGTGTYNMSMFYCDSTGIQIETPRSSNSATAAILPFYVNTRGGQRAPLYCSKTVVTNYGGTLPSSGVIGEVFYKI